MPLAQRKFLDQGVPGWTGIWTWAVNSKTWGRKHCGTQPPLMPNSVYHYPPGDFCSRQKLHPMLTSYWLAGLLKAPDSQLQFDFYLIFYLTEQYQGERGCWYISNMIYQLQLSGLWGFLTATWPVFSAFLMFALLPWPCSVTWNSFAISLCVSTSEPGCQPGQACQLVSQGFGMGSAAHWGAQSYTNLQIPSLNWAFISLQEQRQAFSIIKQRSKPVAVFCLACRVFKYWEISHKIRISGFSQKMDRAGDSGGYWIIAVPSEMLSGSLSQPKVSLLATSARLHFQSLCRNPNQCSSVLNLYVSPLQCWTDLWGCYSEWLSC